MSRQYKMTATKREGAGKGAARAIRRDKQTPAVIYGDKKEPVTISLPTKETNLEYNKGHMFTMICELDVDGEKHTVLARDAQLHPVTDNVMHVDFLRVTDKTSITVSVPVNYIGYEESPAAQAKGILNVVRFEVDINCKAKNIPESIDVDLSKAQIGDAIKISNANMPEGAKPAISDRDFALAAVSAPRVVLDDEPAEGEEGETAQGDAPAEENKE
ncbi:MAG: 50S ribosomal protein L25/general stress protein Ctc [Alphaproteobacteria bacterium]|nr:50S ribosomal protein L25/general stress protein Ctc [Alphaproteobacteria bacterium]NCQ88210.1 50S ribosomal protein L25/general stress protein Ctc [Alphaproteobacteria bacterium]NCT05283.1 50S ribosomal protein L25/general stress protein Ctc [Alphaproteobacteria bacterium]